MRSTEDVEEKKTLDRPRSWDGSLHELGLCSSRWLGPVGKKRGRIREILGNLWNLHL